MGLWGCQMGIVVGLGMENELGQTGQLQAKSVPYVLGSSNEGTVVSFLAGKRPGTDMAALRTNLPQGVWVIESFKWHVNNQSCWTIPLLLGPVADGR